MADPDPVEVGLERTRLELEELANRLSPETPSESPPKEAVDPLNSTMACDAGYAVASGLGELFRAVLFRERPERLVQANQRPRSRFTSPAHAAAAAPPLRPAVTALPPALLSGGQPEPPKISGTPNTEMSFVGFLPIVEKAVDSRRFPTGAEPFSSHEPRLDINDRRPLPRSKELKGPIVGGIIPSE